MTTDDAPTTVTSVESEDYLNGMNGAHDLDAAIAFQRDLYLYWWAARELGELTLTSRGVLTRATLRRLRAQWPVTDDDRAEADDPRRYFLRRLLERLGLLHAPAESGGPQEARGRAEAQLVAADPAMMARFLAHPLVERLRICIRLWVAGGWWPDGKPGDAFSGSHALHTLHTPAHPRIALARRRLVETLAALEPGSPVEAPGRAMLAAFGPRIIGATAQTGQTGKLARSGRRRKPRDIAEERDQVMRAALIGPLRWMGLVIRGEAADVALDAPGAQRLIVSRAALALRNDPDDATIAETPGRVIIQPNLDALAYPPLTAPTLFTLDSCATRGALDRVARYKLTRADVTRAQQQGGQGWSEEELARRLEALTGQPLPGAVRVRLGDWTRAASRLRLTPRATLLSTATPAVLDALLADRTARDWIVRRLGPVLALIATEEIEAVRRWLLAHGELPAIEQPEE